MRASIPCLLLLAAGCGEAPPLGEATRAATVETTLVAKRATWSFWYQGEDLGTAWRAPDWPPAPGGASGAGPLGYGESYLATSFGFGADPAHKPVTVYFRRDFTVSDPAAVTSLRLDAMYDDGLVVYLNGQEAGRASMPAGTVSATTLSTGHEANNAYLAIDLSAARGALRAGANTIAIEVHQVTPDSSDLVFDAALVAEVGSTPPPSAGGIARGATWAAWDRGGELGSAWRAGGYDDSGWAAGAGPLGYGESYLATTVGFGPDPAHKYLTTYFRKQFTLSDPAVVTALRGEVMYDDGFVVYLNGNRIGDASMPAGTPTATTPALGHEANGYQSFDWSAQRGLLVAGTNTVAVEVHQSDGGSSDLVFDLALVLTTGAPPPPPPPPPPGALQVCASGAPYQRIGDAIAAAPAGATISICPGTYAERLTISGKPLTLVGSGGAGATIVDGGGGRVLDVNATGGTGVRLDGLTFQNGATSSNGGGIRCTNSTLRMVNAVVRGSSAASGGGLAASACGLDIAGTRFEQNRASAMGGGALLESSTGQIMGSQFVANRGVNGGGLTAREGSVSIDGNSFTDNLADLRGGGLYHESDALVANSSFTNNDAGWTGGGIHTVGHAATLQNNVITGSTSVNDGGGIYLHQGTPTLRGNRFEANSSGDDGGGVRAFESRCRLESNTIIDNHADDSGGGIRVSHLPCQIIGNLVRNNSAGQGAGMDLDNDASVVRGGEITGNRASGAGGGIAMKLAPWSGATLEDVVISDNQAASGGGVYLDGNFEPITLRGLTMSGNRATDGAALRIGGTEFTLTRSILRNNTATGRGGAIYTGSSSGLPGRIANIVIHANSAPSGAGLSTSSTSLTVVNTIFSANSGGNSVSASVAPIFRYNDTIPATFSGLSPIGSSGNISADPRFVSSTDFHLASGSPCIDSGDPGILDSDGTRSDMGRYGGP